MTNPELFIVSPLESTPEYSLVEIYLRGINHPVVNNGSDTFYRVEEGSVVFAVNGARHPLRSGDTIFVPRGARYQDMSALGATLLACAIPPFDPTTVSYTDS